MRKVELVKKYTGKFVIVTAIFMAGIRYYPLAITLLLSNCTTYYDQIFNDTSKIGIGQGLVQKTYQTKNFKIYTLQRITDLSKGVRIYFEGDGKTFIEHHVVSPNPTPTSYFLINLIEQDRSPNVVYIARPCQFINDKKCYQGEVPEQYWTSAKFSKEVIDSINEVVKDFSDYKLELVGYSGGATIMKYVAYENQKEYHNIVNLRSIAGDLDHKKFAEINQQSITPDFIDEKLVLETLKDIPQIHFVGKDDKSIPAIVIQTYLKKLGNTDCVKINLVTGVSHSNGWQEIWADLLQIQPACINKKHETEIVIDKQGSQMVLKKFFLISADKMPENYKENYKQLDAEDQNRVVYGVVDKDSESQNLIKQSDIFIQAGSFRVKKNAYKALLDSDKIAKSKLQEISIGNQKIYQVLIGPIEDKKRASAILKKIRNSGYKDAFIVQ